MVLSFCSIIADEDFLESSSPEMFYNKTVTDIPEVQPALWAAGDLKAQRFVISRSQKTLGGSTQATIKNNKRK